MICRVRSVVLAALVAGASFAGNANAADKVTFQLDWTPGGISAAWYLGVEKGCFTDQGIDLTITRGYGAADAVTKIGTGVAEFGITDLGVIIASIANNQVPVKAIMPVVSQSPAGLAVLEDSPIKTLKDLEGHSVASSNGNAAMQLLPLGMKLADADMSKVKVLTAEPATLNGLLLQGRTDSLASYVTSTVGLQSVAKKVGKSVRSIGYGVDLDIYNASVFTSTKLLAEKPELAARFVKAAECTYDLARKDPEASIDAMVASVEGMQKASQTDIVPFAYDFAFNNKVFEANGYRFDMTRVSHNIDVVAEALSLKSKPKAADVVAEIGK
ncbi:ABC transporter substrate-binding protein [Rhizobium halophytocola]|uniref:NitT/TauT family transport system substrate-binding protein n=1 Tax=Rhizobium halophytocola TaxID=735519 RepID=A0ABS4DU35_9HYPH|nr:ABC transporter substrate-binding protein [Rhizobium halophytocola]MBP1849196.1 NitT/TauT family transport system substrate-binding protein [Rhizobium halophytocola]